MSSAEAATRCRSCRRVVRSSGDNGEVMSSSRARPRASRSGNSLARLGGQRHRERSSILGMRPAFGESLAFEAVDDGDHGVAVDAQPGRQLALGLAVFGGQGHQHGVGPRIHPGGGQRPTKLGGHVGPELGQQERNALVEGGDPGRVVIHVTNTSTI